MKALKLDVDHYLNVSSRVGDSGYMSFQGQPHSGLAGEISKTEISSQTVGTEMEELDNVVSHHENQEETICAKNQIEKSHVDPPCTLTLPKDDLFSATLNLRQKTTEFPSHIAGSATSLASSTLGDEKDLSDSFSTENWEIPSSQILEHLAKSGGRGNHKSEVQLRLGYGSSNQTCEFIPFIFQIFATVILRSKLFGVVLIDINFAQRCYGSCSNYKFSKIY